MKSKFLICAAACAVLLSGCSNMSVPEQTDEASTESASEKMQETDNAEETDVELSDDTIIEKGDFDDDGEEDTLYYVEGKEGLDVHVAFAEGEDLFLGTYVGDAQNIEENIMLAQLDIDGDGKHELDFETTYNDSSMFRRYVKLFVPDGKGNYKELEQKKVSEGETFTVSREDTRITVKCEAADFADCYWDEVSRIYYNYGIGFGSTEIKLKPVVTGLVTSGDGTLDHIEYSYVLGNRGNGIYIKESVSLSDDSIIDMERASSNDITDSIIENDAADSEYSYEKSYRDKMTEDIRDIVRSKYQDAYFVISGSVKNVVIEIKDTDIINKGDIEELSGKIISEYPECKVSFKKLTWPADEPTEMADTPKAPSDVIKLGIGDKGSAKDIREALVEGKSCYVLDDSRKLMIKTIGQYVAELPYGIPSNVYDSARLYYVDIDDDGEKECAITGAFDDTIILKEYSGKVYMYSLAARAAEEFLENGVAVGRDGVTSEDFTRIIFSQDGKFTTKSVAYCNEIGQEDGKGYIPGKSDGDCVEVTAEKYEKWRDRYIRENSCARKFEFTASGVDEMMEEN